MVASGRARRRPGRPPETQSAETRGRILAAARACFATDGYDRTTNKDIAGAAGVTPAALYHYFDSKQDLFAASYEEMLEVVFTSLARAAGRPGKTIERLSAVLEETARLNAAEPSFATFVATAPLDMRRHPELASLALTTLGRLRGFYGQVVTEGIARGEISEAVDSERVIDLFVVLTSGLANFAAFIDDPQTQEGVTKALLLLLEGSLLDPEDAARG